MGPNTYSQGIWKTRGMKKNNWSHVENSIWEKHRFNMIQWSTKKPKVPFFSGAVRAFRGTTIR